MSKKTRAFIVAGAWGGWIAAGLITFSALVIEEAGHPFFGRLFALLALTAAVLTVVAFLERSSLRNPPPPANVAHTLGFQQGWEARGILIPDQLPPITVDSPWWETPKNRHTNADTGPIGRLPI